MYCLAFVYDPDCCARIDYSIATIITSQSKRLQAVRGAALVISALIIYKHYEVYEEYIYCFDLTIVYRDINATLSP